MSAFALIAAEQRTLQEVRVVPIADLMACIDRVLSGRPRVRSSMSAMVHDQPSGELFGAGRTGGASDMSAMLSGRL